MTSLPNTEQGHASLWTELRAAMRGQRRDYTTGSLNRAILVLAVPMVLEMLMQSVFEVADIYFVGRLGADAVAAAGITASVLVLVFAVGMGLAMAAGAIVARRIGEKKPGEAAKGAAQAILVALGVSVAIGIAGAVWAADLLRLMGATDAVVDVGTGYARITFGANGTILLLFLINAVLRSAGDAVAAMRVLMLANALNILLDPILIFGLGPIPAMGVTGAAVATTIGRGTGVAYQLYLLFRGSGMLRLRLADFGMDRELIARLLRISGPGMFQFLIATASWMLLMMVVARFGSEATAGYTIAIRVLVFALLPGWGIANAAATLVGQNLGALKPDRAERAVWICSAASAVLLGIFGAVVIVLDEPIMRLFTADEEVVRYGAACTRIVGYVYALWAIGMTTVQAFNGAGDTRTPTWINLAAFWIIGLPAAWILAVTLDGGPDGVFTAIAASQVVLAVIGALWFRAGTWKRKVV